MTLTARQVETAKPKEKSYKLTDGEGLYLFVAPTGGRSWRANFTVGGKQGTKTYGRWPAMSLAEARAANRGIKEEGHGTLAMVSDETGTTFKKVARDWMLKHLPGLSNPKHKIQVENTLERFVFPKLGTRLIHEIRRPELVAVVQAIQAKDAGRVETAHRVAGRITSVFNHAIDTGVMESHPAASLSRVLIARSVKKPMACIHPEEVGQLLRDIDQYAEPVTRLGLLLTAYTFPRVGEVLGFRKDELKEDGGIWVAPAERVKGKVGNKLPHVIPLAEPAKKIVRQLLTMSDSELVLDSPARPGHPLSENTLLFALYRMGYKNRMTVHGFRALASTVLNEQSGFPHDVIERQLAHKETDQVRAAYNRAEYLPQRRELMIWWANWLDEQRAKH